MANYGTHTTLNLTIGLPLSLGVILLGLHWPYPLVITFVAAFAYGTLFMSPDVDKAHQIPIFSIRGILSLPFRTYAMIFPHALSHSWFLGTTSRIAWLALHVLPVLYLVYEITPTDRVLIKFLQHNQWYFISAFAGLFLADTGHLIVEGIWSRRKKST